MRFHVVVLIVLLGCKSKEPAKQPQNAAAPKAAEPQAASLPGPCVALPTGELDDSLDIDGDGTKDAIGPDSDASCNKYDCPRQVFVRRGACGHVVGTVSVGYSATLTIQPGRAHGLANLQSDGLGGTLAYTFDGTKYIERRIGEVPPPKQID